MRFNLLWKWSLAEAGNETWDTKGGKNTLDVVTSFFPWQDVFLFSDGGSPILKILGSDRHMFFYFWFFWVSDFGQQASLVFTRLISNRHWFVKFWAAIVTMLCYFPAFLQFLQGVKIFAFLQYSRGIGLRFADSLLLHFCEEVGFSLTSNVCEDCIQSRGTLSGKVVHNF